MVLAPVWVFATTQPRIPSVFYPRAVLRIELVNQLMEGGFGHERFNGFQERRGTDRPDEPLFYLEQEAARGASGTIPYTIV